MPVINTTNIHIDLASAGCPECQKDACTLEQIRAHDFSMARDLPYNDAEVKVPESPYKDHPHVVDNSFYTISKTNKDYYGDNAIPSLLDVDGDCTMGYDSSNDYKLDTIPYKAQLPECAMVGDIIKVKAQKYSGSPMSGWRVTSYTLTAEDITAGEAIMPVRITLFQDIDTLKGNIGLHRTFISLYTYRTTEGITVDLAGEEEEVLFWHSDLALTITGVQMTVSRNPNKIYVCAGSSIRDNNNSYSFAGADNANTVFTLNGLGVTQVKYRRTSRVESYGDGIENGKYKYLYLYDDADDSTTLFNEQAGCTAINETFHTMPDTRGHKILKDCDITIDISAQNENGKAGHTALNRLGIEHPNLDNLGIKGNVYGTLTGHLDCPANTVNEYIVDEYPRAGTGKTGGNSLIVASTITDYTVDNDYMRNRTAILPATMRQENGDNRNVIGDVIRINSWETL